MADKDNDRAIIIDDEESVCETLELFLSNMGFFEEIVICQDGNEALKKLSNHDYSIVLLDLNMPGIDGFEVINKLKEEHKTDETFVQRIIIVSGGLGIDNIEKANRLYDEGQTITYWTARGCKSGKTAEYFRLTYEQLICYNVKFHELRMGKPHFDSFIDDKNINAIDGWNDDNINKILSVVKENDNKRVD